MAKNNITTYIVQLSLLSPDSYDVEGVMETALEDAEFDVIHITKWPSDHLGEPPTPEITYE
jgi:hypothetical protein